MIFQQMLLAFSFITFASCCALFYLWLTHRHIRSFLHVGVYLFFSSVILFSHYHLEFSFTPIGPVFWSKLVYLGIFGYLYAFPSFVGDLIENPPRPVVRRLLACVTLTVLALVSFTELIITNRVNMTIGTHEAGRGTLYPAALALILAICIYYTTRLIAAARKPSLRAVNYKPVVYAILIGLGLSVIDVIGIAMDKPVIPGLREPFLLSIFLITIGFVWSYLSQFSWMLTALDRSESEVLNLVAKSNQSFIEFVQLIAKTLDAKDPYTAGHSWRVMDYSVKIARALKLPEAEIEALKQACLLHDIGKIRIPDGILNKKSPLTEKDWEFIYQHPRVGRQILSTVSDFQDILDIIYSHHEHVDGKGYPRGLKHDEIPRLARILAVADAYDAMRSIRPYRKAKNKVQAQTELERVKGTQLDPAIVEAFIEIIAFENPE